MRFKVTKFNKLLLVGAVLISVGLTGCGGASEASQVEKTTAAAASPTSTSTPTATVAQFASIITEREADWREYEDNIVDCALASIGKTAIDSIKRTTCGYSVTVVVLTAKQAAAQIRKLPTPPAEVQSLVKRTLTNLDALAKNPAPTACEDKQSEACDAAITQANGEIRPLITVLDAWKPYTR
ncbi:hypothetical protein [Paenarthrobacter ureafaciens]|uniref:hypothetical protein n=1 Tax=Paenarthrobacter ureafaciens TaxID=37931 RepID=UPI0014091F30|nr:hypothetical protein [Paenarthrobacter ureafaciens]MCX8454606.1 hypothetical protein [Paenarthrobacter ureafaciens]MCY0974099.1 hypothetical protein [Paenarthrobacter ureafaciens]